MIVNVYYRYSMCIYLMWNLQSLSFKRMIHWTVPHLVWVGSEKPKTSTINSRWDPGHSSGDDGFFVVQIFSVEVVFLKGLPRSSPFGSGSAATTTSRYILTPNLSICIYISLYSVYIYIHTWCIPTYKTDVHPIMKTLSADGNLGTPKSWFSHSERDSFRWCSCSPFM